MRFQDETKLSRRSHDGRRPERGPARDRLGKNSAFSVGSALAALRPRRGLVARRARNLQRNL